MALQPKILALDEPVSALDVSIQAGIINLLLDLQERFGLSYLFVSHDLSVVKHLADRLVVMFQGSIVEAGDAAESSRNPSTSTPGSCSPRCRSRERSDVWLGGMRTIRTRLESVRMEIRRLAGALL